MFLFNNCFTRQESDEFLGRLKEDIAWTQESVYMYGKDIPLPRMTAWYGDEGMDYSYSGIKTNAKPWIPILLAIKERIEKVSGSAFNSVLLNHYRSGKDSVSWHADDEPELGVNPTIGSVSFGATRKFKFMSNDRSTSGSVDLAHGSFLLMGGAMQHNWKHSISKVEKKIGERINLTFRTIVQ